MAETAYERFLKDTTKDEAVEIDIKDQKPIDLDEVKFKIQETLTEQTEPKKPVKLSKWNKYVKNKKNHIRYKSGKNKGKLNLKAMAKAGGFGGSK